MRRFVDELLTRVGECGHEQSDLDLLIDYFEREVEVRVQNYKSAMFAADEDVAKRVMRAVELSVGKPQQRNK